VAYPPVQGVAHASSMTPLLTGLLATCHVCSTRSTLPSPATLSRPHIHHQSRSLRHPGAARTGSVASTTSPVAGVGWSAGAWPYWPGPLRTSAAGAPLASGAFTTGQATTPGMHRAALRVPGGRPPPGGNHQRRDAVGLPDVSPG